MTDNSQIYSLKEYTDSEIKQFYPIRVRNSHKGTYGSANIIAGSDKYIGAAALAAEAALKSGCGYVKLTAPDKVRLALAAKYPQVIYLDEPDLASQTIAIGMGLGLKEEVYLTIKHLLSAYDKTLIIDADGLNALAKYGTDVLKTANCRVVLTPHVKEFSRLTGIDVKTIMDNPVNCALDFANEYKVTVLLKGADSIIADGARIAINKRGTTALAKAGSGDMLSGFMCGCAARGLEPFDAAVCASYTLGVSAEISSLQKTDYCATAKDILNNIHNAVNVIIR